MIFLSTLKYRNTGKRNTRILNLVWINRISLVLGACFAYLLILVMTGIGNLQVYGLGTLVLGSVLIIVFFSFFLEPHILYGSLGTKQERKKNLQKRVQSTRFTPEEQHFQNALERYFREETHYLTPEFRQQDLAEHLGLSRNTISYLINKIYQKNFNQLINEKRIEIAQQYMQSEKWQHLSLEGIAREVGFKSRTTFNKAFKNKTGLTPSEFKNA
jgi:AraC-like DNA-binding protein